MSSSNILTNVKIIKRHSAPGVIIGVLCLFTIIIPAFLWIYPWFAVSVGAVTANGAAYTYQSGGVSLNMVHLMMTLFNKESISAQFVIHNGWVSYQLRDNILSYYLVRENLYAAAVWYLLSAFNALILFIYGFVFLIKGRIRNFGGLLTFAFFYFFSVGMILADAFRLGWYLQYSMKKGCEASGMTVEGYKYMILPALIAGIAALVIYLFILIFYLGGFRKKYYQEDLEIIETEAPGPYERNDGAVRNTLPNYVTSIGNHEYSKNTNLEIVTIPDAVKELGIGAFSNCLKLKVVTIPTSVKRIGSNCFFNCPKLIRVNYAGSKEDWRHVSRGTNWLAKSGTTTVVCSDGPVTVNPYK